MVLAAREAMAMPLAAPEAMVALAAREVMEVVVAVAEARQEAAEAAVACPSEAQERT